MDADTGGSVTVATTTAGVVAPPDVDPRRWHFRQFYGLVDVDPAAGVVLGNCQAESLRIMIDEVAGPTIRMPAVHELVDEDVPHLQRLLATAAFVVTQPIRDEYRGMPVGTSEVRAQVRRDCRVVTVPNVRFAGTYPFQTALRVPGVDEDPPLVAYHDVRTLAAVAGETLPERIGAAQVRAVAEDSRGELRAREQANDTDVVASDLFDSPTFEQMRTVNHAGNPVWTAVGERVLAALGSDAPPADPGRPLLASVQTPREDWVADVWGLADARPEWRVDGVAVDPDVIRRAHTEWYRAHPAFVAGALQRLAPTFALWRAA